jgi:GAF domain-containing protein
MDAKLQVQRTIEVASLVNVALNQSKFSGLSEMLKGIAEAMNAYGCILWQVAPSLDGNPLTGRLFTLAQWFKDNRARSTSYYLPLGSSVIGKAILTGRTINVKDIELDSSVFESDPFLSQGNIRTFCSIPIRFLDEAAGAINLYRDTASPLAEDEIAQAEVLASIVPALYQAIRDKVSLNLIQSIDSILHQAEPRATETFLSKEKVNEVMQRICAQVTDALQSFETSIFIEDYLEEPGLYKLIATTWPSKFMKTAYKRTHAEGLTGWVLANSLPVRIFDLTHFERDKRFISNEYPFISWQDSLGIASAVRQFLKLGVDEELPPLSFMAVPIVRGDRVLGVIRCSAAKTDSYYFAERELRLLKLVAAQISNYWINWQSRREISEENSAWRTLVESIGKLNTFAQNELTREMPDEQRIFAETLKVTSSVIEGAEITDIRLLDENTNELYYAEVYGPAWNEGTKKDIRERRERRFKVGTTGVESAGAFVFQTGQLYITPNVEKDPYHSETIPNTKRMIVAPIRVENKVFGVLDIRIIGDHDFPKHATAIAELLGQQLGLYCYLAQAIRRLQQSEADLWQLVTTQNLIFEDLQHQLRSPIFQAYARIESLLSGEWNRREEIELKLRAIRGLFGKAKRVATNTKLFTSLARSEPVKQKLSRLCYDNLIRLLIEAGMDNRFMVDPNRAIKNHVESKTFDVLRSVEVKVDFDLLEQAVYNILDNAYKYSFNNTTIRIYGGLTSSRRFHITFVNQGIPIRHHEVNKCMVRGWRSEEASLVTGEGSGIGLWIVDHIMKLHNGELIIIPTTDHLTEIKLVFPVTASP